jgi:hypothetical protein
MSTETHVFFRGKLPSKAALTRAMKELGFPFSISPPAGSLEQQSGFMPMRLRREETGVELDVFSERIAVEEFACKGIDPSFERRASFRWAGDAEEAAAGLCGAAALAKLIEGVVFDEGEDKLLSADDAIALARRSLPVLVPEATARPGTRPTDIKRYLKPLLQQRSDLVLLGRLLIIRPVRHLLRGVYFDRTSDKYLFRVWRHIQPLFPVDGGFGYRKEMHPVVWRVWQPYFKDLLFDSLAEDIFDFVGKIRTLDDFASKLDVTYLDGQTRFQFTRITALFLAGQRERADALVDDFARAQDNDKFWGAWVEAQHRFLARDVASVCAEFRAKEEAAAKELKLGDIWEPTPFPAEVPEAERVTRCAEPAFPKAPWIAGPPGLVQEAPEHPGELCFATEALRREDRIILLAPLTREAAEEKHRTRQDYVLATRLPAGNLLVLRHRTWWSPHDPEQPRNPEHVPRRKFYLEVYGSLGRCQTEFWEDGDQRGILEMHSVDVFDRVSGDDIWYAVNDFKKAEKAIYDDRGSDHGRRARPMTAFDRSLGALKEPPFGEFDNLWRLVTRYLKNEGFGTFS